MATMTLPDLSKKMSEIDFTMLSTFAGDKRVTARPMSNNGDVEYEGDSFFFSYDDTRKTRDIEANPEVGMTLTGSKSLLGKPGIFIAIDGKAELIRDKASFEEHWVKDLEIWFPDGIDTPNIVLIKVHAKTIRYWDGDDEGEIPVK